MRRSWAPFAFGAALVVALTHARAEVDYDKILAAQPPGLTVTLTLPKDHFYQGEVIPATLIYTNTSTTPYVADLIPMDRSGRNQDVRFFGTDAQGAAVEDPIDWLYYHGYFGGGRTNMKDLGTASLVVIANQWLRFDQPGAYTLYATTTTVHGGAGRTIDRKVSPELVTNKVTITITPLDAAVEKQIITDSTRQIDAAYQGEDFQDPNADHTQVYAVEPQIEILRYLQTPAARAALRARLDKTPEVMLAGGHFQLECGLLGAADRPAEAALILDDVKAGRLKVDSGLIGLYAQLKTYPLFMETTDSERKSITPDEFPQRMAADAAYDKGERDAQKEIVAAAKQASAQTGSSDLDLVWAAYLAAPFDPDCHAQAVAHQIDFSHDRQLQLLSLLEMRNNPHLLLAK